MSENRNGLVRFGSKSFFLTLAVIILLGSTISATVAWMFIKSEPVNNTFTYGDMKISLTETDTEDNDDDKNTNSYSFTPGADIAKDPKVTVAGGSESCWLFVKITESANFDTFMTYSPAEGWAKLQDGVYYRKVSSSASPQNFDVLAGNKVSVKEGVTQQMLDALVPAEYPTLQFEAYAVQLKGLDTPAAAWAAIK